MLSDFDPVVSSSRALRNTFLTPPDSPTDAYRAVFGVLHSTVMEAARRRQEELPGLVETLQGEVVLTTGGTSRLAYGWFAEGAWRYGDRHVHELFLNADRRVPHQSVSVAEDVLVTLLHEACHVWAQLSGVRDTSRDGRYHTAVRGDRAGHRPGGGEGHGDRSPHTWSVVVGADRLRRSAQRVGARPGAGAGAEADRAGRRHA